MERILNLQFLFGTLGVAPRSSYSFGGVSLNGLGTGVFIRVSAAI